MVTRRRLLALAGIGVLVLAACGPAATGTPTPTQPGPRATAVPTTAAATTVAATATPRVPPPSGGATPQPSPTPAPTAVAAGGGPKYGGSITYGLRTTPQFWDIIGHGAAVAEQMRVGFIYNRLMERNSGAPACALYPLTWALGESFRWIDDKTFEIKIKPGIRFQNRPPANGREVVASDIIFNLTGVAEKGVAIPDVPKAIERTEAVDKYTVRLYLKQPFAVLPGRVVHDRVHIFNPEAVGEDLKIDRGEDNVGTGPFMFKQDVPGVKAVLERNPDYWDKGLPYLDEIQMNVMPDESTRAAAFRSGKLDMFFAESMASMTALAKLPGVSVDKCPEIRQFPLAMPINTPPFDDVRVRQALAMAIDQKKVIDLIYLGNALDAYLPVYPFNTSYMKKEDYPKELQQFLEYNPQKAKEMLAEAGYPNGFDTVYNYQSGRPYEREVGELLVDMLQQVGIRVKKVQGWDAVQFGDRRREMKFEGITHIVVGLEPPLEQLTRHYSFKQGLPYWSLFGFRSDKLDDIFDKLTGRVLPDAEVDRQLKDLQILFAREQINIRMPIRMDFNIRQPRVKNVYYKTFYTYNVWEWMYKAYVDK
ncbi:MAG: ABC transporter substrate-binding protein [Chloroflexi bacterium]|nr:ABC transporter substrate-binding protein [Chloroflexota bacterium]